MISMRRRGWRLGLPLVAALAALATACGSNNNNSSTNTTAASGGGATTAPAAAGGGGSGSGPTCATGSITGAGSTFVNNIALEWIKNYTAKCHGATINYQSVGSGAGITQFTSGTVNFGATDVPLTAAQTAALQSKGPTVQIPWAAGGIALEYNLSGVNNLKLDATTIASIFAGKINKWNAPAIKALNPGANLPSSSIATVHRSDSSGTSGAFTEYLSKTAPSVWTFGSNKTWPGPGGTGAKGSDGVTATVSQTSGAIGYAEVSYAVGANLPVVQVKNASGAFTSPKVASAVAATLAGVTIGPAGALTINYDTMNPAAYPIATPTYVVALKSGGSPLVKDFILYAVTQGQSSADQLFYAPLPQNLVSFAEQAINSMT